ncbi:MAG: insulinase family protein [Planctomycetes bacterium]|nr:insulinase family protein [Planctomycetota bacterium]
MKTKLTFAMLLALVVLSGVSNRAQESDNGEIKLDAKEFTLENGLKVVVVNRPGVPVVSTYVWYAAGACDETPQKTGMAHFLEHMMFKGSSQYKKGDIDAVTSRNGGSNNAFTSNDYTAYYIDLPKSRYLEALKIEADRMRRLTLDQAEFDAEKKVVQSETDISNDDPNDQLWIRLYGELFGASHPYAHPVLGWRQDIEDITRSDMRAFYDRHYFPNHATLILSGDITLEEAKPEVERLFAGLQRGPEPNRPKAEPMAFKGRKSFEVKSEGDVVTLVRAWPGVTSGHNDEAALDVLGMILGDGVTSRLYRELVDESGLCNDAGAGNSTQMLGGMFYVYSELPADGERESVLLGIEAAIARLVKDGIKPAEIERAKRRVVAQSVFGQESSSNIAQMLGSAQVVNGDWRAALKYPARVKAVVADDVLRVARQYLGSGNHVSGWLVPELSKPDEGAKASDAKPQPLPIERYVLENGLTILLYPRSGLPIVSVNASVRAGRATEPLSKTGIANFAGSLLDTGTATRSKLQIAEAIEGVGGQLSLGSGGGSLRVLSENTALGLDLLSDCMLNPAFQRAEIELARKQLLASIESSKDDPGSFARDAANAWLYGADTPFGRPAQGTAETIKGITREDLAAWHQKWFRPDNCIIAVVGDFKSKELLQLVKDRFGGWKKPQEPLAHPVFEFKPGGKLNGEQKVAFGSFDASKVDASKKRICVDHPEKKQVVVRLMGMGIRRDNPDYFPLLVMDNILGTSSGFADRFSKKLRDELGLAYSTYANMTSSAGYYEGAFLGYIGTRPENVELALRVMYQLIDEIRTAPVSDKELRDAKDFLKGSFVFGLETTGQLAGLMVEVERYKLGADYLVKYAENVEAVAGADILRVARKYLVPESMVEVMCGPIEQITPAGEATPPHKDEHDGGK